MTATLRPWAIAATTLFLAGCAATPSPRVIPAPAASEPPASAIRPPVQDNNLIGRGIDNVERMFGKPRLDITEGAGRKLQFSGTACILDVYFYAQRQGSPQLATHVDARTPDGKNAEANSCIAALRR